MTDIWNPRLAYAEERDRKAAEEDQQSTLNEMTEAIKENPLSEYIDYLEKQYDGARVTIKRKEKQIDHLQSREEIARGQWDRYENGFYEERQARRECQITIEDLEQTRFRLMVSLMFASILSLVSIAMVTSYVYL